MSAKSNLDYRPDIDGLRAIAVLSVVVFHAFPNLAPGGFVGVDVFFVISGFLISRILLSNLKDDEFSISGFYAKRIKRIFPALLIVLYTVLLFGWLKIYPMEYSKLGFHVAAGSGFFSNILLWQESGYFDASSLSKPLLHLWSLAIEEQFYLIWPILLLLASRVRYGFNVIFTLIIATSFGWSLHMIAVDPVCRGPLKSGNHEPFAVIG